MPYHLRQNKAIERALFIDLLARVGRYRNISDYRYIGFGGPYLEDFKVLHSSLRIRDMISLEGDANVAKRQLFNQPLSCIDIRNQTSGEFLIEHSFDKSSVVWFDYVTPASMTEQLGETRQLISMLTAGDVFKITLNANPEALGRPMEGDLKEYRAVRAQERLAEYGPAVIDPDMTTSKNYPTLLLHAIHSAAKKGVEGDRRLFVQPLSAFVYKDGQQMVTATGILLNHADRDPFFRDTRLQHWAYRNLTWDVPTQVSIPDLSAKERMHIESLLPDIDAKVIAEKMGYFVGPDKDEAEVLMQNFVTYYRLSPWFSRVLV
ncbi:O-methyltransferase [Ralstonia mannitolilytica]|uniref:O-methyltransferase n=1 Tax=Ralstonia mannitolilytica TaxID=105219 RepID=UPI00292F4C72|nr:O-methyltransferase [Ralstonia mannitolilytica]